MKLILSLAILPILAFAQLYSSPSDRSELTDLDKIQALTAFRSLPTNTKNKAECYNKAYVWSYLLKKNFNIDSNKLFIFYTDKFHAEVGGDWSYHVSPLVMVRGERAVFDRTFWSSSSRTLSIQSWVDILMKKANRTLETKRRRLVSRKKRIERSLRSSRTGRVEKEKLQIELNEIITYMNDSKMDLRKRFNVTCPVVANISEAESKAAQNSEYCYLLESSMYYKDPVDLRLFESQDIFMTDFNNYDLKKAKKQAFHNWRDLEE